MAPTVPSNKVCQAHASIQTYAATQRPIAYLDVHMPMLGMATNGSRNCLVVTART